MSILNCKMCGGELEIAEGSQIAKCRYCGTKQTVPKLDSEKKSTLFARANRLRFNSEFDKAAGVYESIVAEFPEEAEAYWGLVLCKYGIEYVDDPATAKKIPTCHRSSYESVMDDTDYEQTLENASPETRAVYREEAKAIEALRQSIVEVSSKEEPYDIFICYKETDLNGNRTIDSVIAQDVYEALTDKGYRVFFSRISLEDKLGREYEPYIFAALNSAKIMLAFGSDYEYYNAVWVKNEWSRFIKLMATDRSKTLIPCYKGIDAYDMPKEFIKLQSQDMGKVGAIQDLLRGIEKILPKKKPEVHTETKTVEKIVEKVVVKGNGNGADTGSLLERAEIFLEDGDFTSANAYAEKVLDIDPKCAEAYVVKLCCDLKVKKRTNLGKQKESFSDNANYKKALRFADDSLKDKINAYAAQVEESIAESLRVAQTEKVKRTELIKKYHTASRMIAAGIYNTLGLKSDGTAVAVGRNDNGQCKVSSWRDVVAVAAGNTHTVGLKSDGTAVSAGSNNYGERKLSTWKNIIAVVAGERYTLGLKADGTVAVAGEKSNAMRKISSWRGIIDIATCKDITLGLKSDGKVVAVGYTDNYNIADWRDIIAVAAHSGHAVGLKSDGTVVSAGSNSYRESNVSSWRDIIAVACGERHTVGLKSDGTVIAVGDNRSGQCAVSDWRDIIAITCGDKHTVGLTSSGKVVAAGENGFEQCNVAKWKLFNSLDNMEKEKQEADEKRKQAADARREKRKEALLAERAALQTELANLKGLFTGKRKKQINERLTQINLQLYKLNNET